MSILANNIRLNLISIPDMREIFYVDRCNVQLLHPMHAPAPPAVHLI